MNNKNNQNKFFLKQDTIKRGKRWKECEKLIRKNRKKKKSNANILWAENSRI